MVGLADSHLEVSKQKHSKSCVAMAQEAKRLRVADLLRAQVPYSKIESIVGVSNKTICNVQRRLKAGDDLSTKPTGGQNLKVTPEVLKAIKHLQEGPFPLCEKSGQKVWGGRFNDVEGPQKVWP